VEELNIKRTRRGDKMAVIKIEDLSGSIEVILFPDLFARSSALLKSDDPLLITGTVEKGDRTTKIIGQELTTLSSVRQRFIKAIVLNLDERTVSRDLLEDLRDLAFRYPGECRLRFRVAPASGKALTVIANDRFKVEPCHELIREMENLTGNTVREILSLPSTPSP